MDPVQTTSSNRNIVVVLVLLVIILAGTSGYLWKKMRSSSQTPEQIAQAEAKDLAQRVGMLIVLPTDEVPTVATVSDPEALKNQPFFASAKKGDKVLIYTNAKKAILFDPVLNKILNVAPLNIGEGKTTTTVKTETTETTQDSN